MPTGMAEPYPVGHGEPDGSAVPLAPLATVLGPVSGWDPSLREAVDFCMASESPGLVCWGPDLLVVYNSPCARTLVAEHPRPFGQPLAAVASLLGGLALAEVREVLRSGRPLVLHDRPTVAAEAGRSERYFMLRYSPLRGLRAEVAGVLVEATETTGRVVGERRFRCLRDLRDRAVASTEAEAWAAVEKVLSEHVDELAAFAIYRLDASAAAASLVAGRLPSFPARVPLEGGRSALLAALRGGIASIELVPSPIASSASFERLDRVHAIPVDVGSARAALLVATGRRRHADPDFGIFLSLLASQIGSVVAASRPRLGGASSPGGRVDSGDEASTTDRGDSSRAASLSFERGEIREILDRLPDAFMAVGHDWRVRYLNEAAAQVLREATHGRVVALQGKVLWDEFPRLRETNFGRAYERVLRTGESVHLIDFYPPCAGWYEVFAYPIPSGIAIVSRDVTKRRKNEEAFESTRRELAAAERLSALGGLVSGIAHEIRTPLTIIQANAALLAARARAGTASGDLRMLAEIADPSAAEISAAVERAHGIVSSLRRFVRQEPERWTIEGFDAVVEEAVTLFEAATRHRGRIDKRFGCPDRALVNRSQVQQVAINLLENALDASGGNADSITIETTKQDGSACLVVADRGVGMEPSVEARIFEPLYTTKPDGTGLGLSIVKKIVDAHGGSISCETRPGAGTTFRVHFPLPRSSNPS